MTAGLAFAPPTASAQPVLEARIAIVPSAPVDLVALVDRPPAGEWAWRLVTVVLGPVADRNPDVALTLLRTADELVDSARAWVQRLTRRTVIG